MLLLPENEFFFGTSVVSWPWLPGKVPLCCSPPPPQWDGGENRKGQVRKCMGWDKGSLINEGKVEKQVMQMPSQLANGCPGSPQATATLEKNFCPWVWHYMIWIISWVSSDQLLGLCCLPASCPPSAYLLLRDTIRNKRPWICANTTQQQPKHWHVISTVLVTNLKPSTIQGAVRKIITPWQPDTVQCMKNVLEGLILPCCPKFCCHDLNLYCQFILFLYKNKCTSTKCIVFCVARQNGLNCSCSWRLVSSQL